MVVDLFEVYGIKKSSYGKKKSRLYEDEQELYTLDYTRMKGIRRKCVCFSKDGNTVVKPYVTVYPISQICADDSLSGWFMEIRKCESDNYDFRLYTDVGPILMSYGYITYYWTVKSLRTRVDELKLYGGADGLRQELKQIANAGRYINLVQLATLHELGESVLAEHYAQYRNNYIERQNRLERERNEQIQRKEEEQMRIRRMHLEETCRKAEQAIISGEVVENEILENVSLILRLMRKYRINVPVSTQGWINNKLVSVSVTGERVSYTFRRTVDSTEKGSKVIGQCMIDLRNAIQEEVRHK